MGFLSPPPPPSFALGTFPNPVPRAALRPIPTRRRRDRYAAITFPNPFRDPNRTTFLARVHVIERQKLPISVVEEAFNPLARQNVTRKQVEAAIAHCNKWFADNGYPCSRLLILTYPSFMNRTLALYSAEPRLAGIHLLPVDANNKPVEGAVASTKVALVARVLKMKIGDVFTWRPDGFGSLMALGIFDFADAEVNVVTNERVELTLRVKERPSCRIEPGAGINSDGRMYGDISFIDNNFRGRAQRIRMEWQKRLDSARAAGCLAFEDMRLGAKIPVSLKLRLYRDANSSRGIPAARMNRMRRTPTLGDDEGVPQGIETPLLYEKDRDGVILELGYRPGKGNLLLTGSSIAESVQPNPSERATRATSVMQTVLQTGISHITRLPIDCPRFGHIVTVENSVGRTYSGAAMMFRKTLVRLAQYFALGPHASIAAGVNLGFGSENLPWHEQRSLGGSMNVRGYNYGELGRYKSFGTGRLELRVPLTRSIPGGSEAESDGEDESNGARKEKTADRQDRDGEKEKSRKSDKGGDERIQSTGNLVSPKMIESLPPLVGVLFGDIAVSSEEGREPIGTSYGLGLRIGGVISVDWTRTMDGRKSQLRFGLVDRSL